jgi:hypothetical protein
MGESDGRRKAERKLFVSFESLSPGFVPVNGTLLR